MITKALIVGGITVTCCMLANAEGMNGYVGGGLGVTKLNVDCAGTTSCDDGGNGGKVFGGYHFTPEWAVELSYFDFGEAEFTVPIGGSPVSGSLDTSAIGIGAAYHAKLATDWSFTGRLGIARVKTEATAGYRGLTASLSENKVKPYFGLAVGYSMTPGFELQAGWDFSNSADIAGESGAVHLLSVGLSFAF